MLELGSKVRDSDCLQVSDWKFGAIWTVLIVSYESVRKYATQLAGTCRLLICDEGHRHKAAQGNKTIGRLCMSLHAVWCSFECPIHRQSYRLWRLILLVNHLHIGMPVQRCISLVIAHTK